MFKLESYITPILLSYVDKYIKNFRPEDSQLSLWGGDVSFHNLDLRLEVLEQELQLPFSFVSGHIHELLIHVPWTKITSEPITITINTIECILKLKSSSSSNNFDPNQTKDRLKRSLSRRQEFEAPPGYVQSLINKIVNNIKIYCNNLILKYVEEDIVLSMNVKLLTFESANEEWEPGYIDVSQNKVTLRKLINVSDLTICLDKRNAAGKIDFYQEPVLYRCSLKLYMLRYYHSATSKRPTTTRLDIYCDSLEFSATESQIPMLMRIFKLVNALASRELKPENSKRDSTSITGDNEEILVSDKTDNQESWASWAWSFIPSLGSVDEDYDENQPVYAGHTMQIGVYVDNISITFKVSEHQNEKGYYAQRRIKYWPLLSLHLQGVFFDTIMHDIKWSRTSLGASEIVIFPMGCCSCSHTEFQEGTPPYEYLKAGNPSQLYKENSLFDPEAVENKGNRRSYTSLEWSYHLATITEAVLLERTPAFALDLMNQIEIPDDTSSEVLLELSNNRENSNFSERTILRIVFGPFLLRLCSGLLHRCNSLILASSVYDYPPYSVPKPEPLFSELPPPSADDFDALNENIPIKTMQITLVAPVIQIHLLDHPFFVPTKGALFKRKKLSSAAAQIQTNLPHLTLECQCIDITIKNPMYERRLLVTTSQLPDPPQHMFEACYQVINGKILGFQSKLVLESKKHTIIIPPTSAAVSQKSILKPQYWINPDVIHDVLLIESENFSITGTKAKLMVAIFIIDSFWKWNDGNQGNVKSILNTSLLKDTINDNGMIYAELSVENIRFKIVSTASTVAIDTCLDSIKGFVYEQIDFESKDNETNLNDGSVRPPTPKKVRFTDIQQVMFISGAESENSNEDNEQSKKPCVTLTVQFPLSPDSQVHASLFVFDMQEITFCCDPLLLKWLCYSPKRTQKVKVEGTSEVSFRKTKTVSETSSNVETSRKLNTPHESVHSSSDREHLHILTTVPKEPKGTCEEEPTQFLDFVKRWSGIWTCSLVCGHIEQCTIYIPMTSLSAIGSQNIKQAVHKMLWKSNPSDLLVFVTPEVSLKSSVNYETLAKHIKSLPVDIPSSFWKEGKTSFPWYISVDKFGCYTLHQGRRCNIIKNVSFDATVGFSAKSRPTGPVTKCSSGMVKDLDCEKIQHSLKNRLEYVVSQSNSKIDKENCDDVKSMNVCIHFDMKPVHIALSEVQVCLITNIANGFLDKMSSWIYLTPEPKLPEIVPYFSEASTGSPGLRESIVETASEHESSLEKENKEQATTEWSAWIQWTVTRITFELLAYDAVDLYSDDISYSHPPNLKLMFDFEDIVTSLDYQGIYLKVKSKIASASVKHFKRTRNSTSWKPGPVLGILMKERDGVQIDKVEGSDIFSLTITRASCKHTHALWGTRSKVKSKVKNEEATDGVRFITEIDLTLQPIDLILPFTILRDFYMVVEPFLNAPQQTIVSNNDDDILMNINNQNIPLIYLHVEGVRIVLPSAELDDVCIFQIDDITFTPNAINPIIRTPCRPDIYQQGARSRKLNVPGSDIEDRQYQLDIVGICSSTCLWKDLLTILNVNVKESCHLKTMSENPALEWNNLGKNVLSPEPQFNFWPIIKKFDVSVIFAPAMVYKSDTIVCGHSLEINFVSDIEMFVSVNQVNLLWILMNEFLCIRKSFMMADLTLKRPQVMLQSGKDDRKSNVERDPLEQVRDSGIETSEKRSNLSALTTIPFTQECSDVNKIEQDKKTSEKSLSFFNRTPWQIGKQNIPVETVIVGGKLSVSLYLVNNPFAEDKTKHTSKKSASKAVEFEKGYEGSEEGSENYDLATNNFLPLVFIYVYQPSLFASFQQVTRKMQVSVSDLKLKSSSNAYKPLRFVPKEENYPINLLETRAGMPHPDTGVLPTFLTLKWNKSLGKPATLDLDFGKPLKFEVSLLQWDYFLTIRDKIAKIFKPSLDISGEMLPSEQISNLDNFVKHEAEVEDVYLNSTHKKTDTYIKLMHIRKSIFGLTSVNVKSYQVMIVFKTAFSKDGILTVGPFKSFLTIPSRPERINNVTHVENITFSVVDNNKCMVLLHPSNVSIESCFFWEPWQTVNSNPQVQVSIDSDNVHFDFGSKYVKCLQMLFKDFNEIVTSFDRTIGEDDNEISADSKSNPESVKSTPSEKEQHYKDDLRAGAFQFVSATTNSPDELPLPYQVMFWEQSIAAMAWRYPQPRVLTKVRVFPVPFKEASEKYREQQVLCSLEYWADCHCSYQPYTQFFLSESEMCYVDLPQHKSYPTVACIWRVVLHPINYKNVATLTTNDPSKFLISPKALAACLRIDSYFGRNLVPDLSLAVNVETISLSLYTHFDSDVTYKTPDFIKCFTFDGNIPEDQCFATVTFDNCRVHVLSRNFDDYLMDLSMIAKCSILEYSFLTLQNLVEPFSVKIEFDLTKDTKTNILAQPVTVKYGPLIGHTLAVSLQMWSQALEESLTKDLVILTNYVICNDTNLNFVFGQDETDEKIPLSTRCFHLYSWRSAKTNRKLRVSMERFEWRWSAPFQISQDGTDLIDIGFNCHLFVSVKKLSATQKQVVISGSFVLCNMLTEHFEFKVFENIENDKDRYKKARTHIMEGRSVAPSLLLRHDQRYCLRLRFFGIDSAWTGNIPLEINPRNTQPWLVKVPLEERNNFLSVWCKIITQKFGKHVRCLAVLWPLFMIRSNLSIEAQCKVETPALTLSSTSVVAGKGCYQQLYCPGTSDHSHLLSFHFDNGAPAFNSVVPLNYTLIDQKEIFKKHENEDINEVLEVLNNLEKQKWPFFTDELDDVSWFVEDQPLTHVKVSYKEVCPYSNCLLIELLPWCILVNGLGCSIAIVIDNEEACSIRHQGIICPPKMEGDFYLSVDMGTKRYNSQALQLANSEWSKAFYMPKIIGTVPLNGSIQTPIKCGAYICMVSIGSNVFNDMRQLKIGSSHVLVNCMPFQLEVVCFAVPNNENVHSFPKHADKYAFTAAPNLDKNGRGISIIRWYLVDGDINSDFALYMSFAICPVMSWSCPIAVDKGSLRRTGCVKSEEKSIPFVLTCQEHKGVTYVSIHHDTHPQMRIENRSGKRLYFAQYLKGETPIAKSHVNDASHFDWVTFAESGETIYYSLPSFSEKFPDLASDSESERLVIAADAKGNSISSSRWSVPININIFNEHFVRIPYFKDVKVTFVSSTQTTFVTIDSISKAEVSAKDIRIRLALHEKQQYFEMTKRAIQSASEKSKYSRSKDSQSYPIFDEKSNNDNNSKLLPIDSVNISSKILNAQRQTFIIQAFLKGITFTLTSDLVGGSVEMKEIVNVICDDVAFVLEQAEKMCVSIALSEIQIDNQMFARGGYDFPVVLISQSPREIKQVYSLDDPIENSIKECQTDPLIGVELVFEKWKDEVTNQNRTDLEKLKVQLRPLSAFIEDNFIFKLKEYFMASTPGNLVLWTPNKKRLIHYNSNFIELPDHIVLESVILANPITLRSLIVDQWSLLLSVHSSIKVYLALDQSPLQFSKFEHRNVMTTPYRLGYAFTLHYLSGALFGAGWVVGSLELLGSPGTLARAMGSGLKDFVSLPYLGLIQGPWAFVRGVTNGSASLMRHVTAGTLQSVTKLAASVARNLDRLTLDEEHFMRTEEYRRHRPQGITQGFLQGLTGLGISLLGAVGGIAHHPLKSIMSEGASPRGLATGVGLGLVGVFTKPLSGAADLIAQTGEGLLQGAGWNTFPEPRVRPVLQHIVACTNSILKYSWKFSREYSPCTIIFIIEATEMTKDGKYVAIALVLHMDVLLIINTDQDIIEHTLSLTDIEAIADVNDPTLLSFKLLPPKKSLKIMEDDVLEMDPAQRTRVADYVKSTTRLMQFPDDVSLNNSEISVSTCDSSSRIPNETKEVYKFYTYYVNPRSRNYFIKLFNLAKGQHENYSFQFYSN